MIQNTKQEKEEEEEEAVLRTGMQDDGLGQGWIDMWLLSLVSFWEVDDSVLK